MNGPPHRISKEFGGRLLALRDRIVANFTAADWGEVGLLTGFSDLIRNHSRLLRSLDWGDQDYTDNVQQVLLQIASNDPAALEHFDELLNRKYPDETQFISARPSPKKITFAPNVFEIPDGIVVEPDLAALMMPFSAEFAPVHEAIKAACEAAGFRCARVDDVWDHSVIIQEIFTLLLKARVVIVDFTGRNPNVMYETGIAHTLGKLVVPISQSLDDVPFDLKHHRVLEYLPNGEGRQALTTALAKKLGQVNPSGNGKRCGPEATMPLLEKIAFGSFADYSPRGAGRRGPLSRRLCYAVKDDDFVVIDGKRVRAIPHMISRLCQNLQSSGLEEIFDDEPILVPAPRSVPVAKGELYPPRIISHQLVDAGLGGAVRLLLERTRPVQKASHASPEDRPTAVEHYRSLAVRSGASAPHAVLIVDDVITSGCMLLAAASRLKHAFPQTKVRVFALIRTLSSDPVNQIYQPTRGTITLRVDRLRTFRRP